jgi:hypothetical protein
MENATGVKRREFRSESAILELLRDQQRSGLSVRVFCAARSIPEGSFHNWKRRYGTEQLSNDSEGFAQVQLEASPGVLFAEVSGADGYRVKLYQAVSAVYLKELMS